MERNYFNFRYGSRVKLGHWKLWCLNCVCVCESVLLMPRRLFFLMEHKRQSRKKIEHSDDVTKKSEKRKLKKDRIKAKERIEKKMRTGGGSWQGCFGNKSSSDGAKAGILTQPWLTRPWGQSGASVENCIIVYVSECASLKGLWFALMACFRGIPKTWNTTGLYAWFTE